MRAYELTLVLRPALREDERKKLLGTIKGFMGDPKIVKEDDWGQKALAYSIKKESAGYYLRMVVETEREIAVDFEKRLLTNDSVLRHLFLRRKDVKSNSKVKTQPIRQAQGKKSEVKVQNSKTKPPRRQGSVGQAKKIVRKAKAKKANSK